MSRGDALILRPPGPLQDLLVRVCLGLAAPLLMASCLFETRSPDAAISLRPALPAGGQWMYQYREFLRPSSGRDGDTALRFIRYSSPGDTLIAGVTYRLLVEEDLAYYNADQGLVLNRIAFAVLDAGDSLRVNQLRGTANTAGRLPLKAAAGFDTALFEDETTALIDSLVPGRSWPLRAPGHPFGHPRAIKTYLGMETAPGGGFPGRAWSFGIVVTGLEHVRIREWYSPERKVFARSAYASRPGGADSNLTEEEFIGMRGFTAADTLAVLRSAAIIRGMP